MLLLKHGRREFLHQTKNILLFIDFVKTSWKKYTFEKIGEQGIFRVSSGFWPLGGGSLTEENGAREQRCTAFYGGSSVPRRTKFTTVPGFQFTTVVLTCHCAFPSTFGTVLCKSQIHENNLSKYVNCG